MAFNPALLAVLEEYGLTNAALEMLVALCQSHQNGAITWNICQGMPLKFELRFYGDMRERKVMQEMTKLLQS